MIKKKNKIRVLLTEDGSIGKLELPVKLHTGSVNMTDIEVLVPITVNRTSSSFVKIYGNTVNEKGEKVWSSDTYSVNFKTIDVVDKFEYASYEDKLPDEFSAVSGDLNITLAYADLAEDGTAIDILPSQTIHLYVNGAGFNQNGVQISNYDSTVARVNLLSELSVLKIDVSKELPLGIVFNKNGYKSPFYNFYTIEYTLPMNATETATKECKVIANSIVKDSESPEVIGYQTEFAYFDGGICQRTNKYNISQGSVNNYVLLENGAWEIVNQDYITPIKSQVDQNSEDIEVLYRLANTGSTPLGEYPSQDTVPTDSELNQYVQENFGRAPQNGDEFTFVLLVEDGTDIVYILLYSEVTGKWGKTALPSVEPAKNGSMGIIKGTADEEVTATRKVLVDINNGEINDILHNNESGQQESLSAQINRNSQNIAINTTDIAEIEENLSAEITRATRAEESLTTDLYSEIERAKSAEQANTTAIENEVSRATTKEGELDNDKLDKTNVNDDYLKGIVFSINGDNGVATLQLHNPVTGQTQNVEITVTTPASSTNTGLMTSDMVQALNNAIEDIESLKYVGKQVASFQSYAEAELFDFSTLTDVNVNDYFIVQVDESRTEPTEKDQTTKYVCINDATPITLESFQFQSVVTTVNIQVATESKVGGVLSVNTNGYIYVENTGAMKLVGYDNLITSINNLTTAISNETTRAEGAEETLSQAITAETTRAQQAESALQTSKADKTELPTKVSELENDENYATVSQIPTDNSQLANGANYATVGQIPTDNSQLANGAGYVSASQVVRSDVAQTLTNAEKQQAQTNTTHTATQNHATSGVQVGWYQVANLKTNGNYDIKIKQSYNYNLPEAIHLSISINNRLSTVEPFASITQLSGVNPGAFSLSKIRVRQGTDEGTTFLDVYNPDQLWNTTWVDITSDSQDVVVEPNSPFQFIGTEDNPSGYKISSLDLVTGFNTSYLRANTATISGTVSNLNTISQPVNSVVTYSFGSGCANAPITDSGMVIQMQESTAYCTQLVIANDEDASTWRRSYRDGTWTEWTKVGTFLQYEYNKAISFGESGYLYIGKFPIYDTNITVDISSTTSTTYSGKLVIACQNYAVLKASVFGDYSNMVTPNIYYKVVDNTVEVYFVPQAWSKNVIHITGCGIQGNVTHICEKINATLPIDGALFPTNEADDIDSTDSGYGANNTYNYIRYKNGLQICWGRVNTGDFLDVTFPVPFINTNYTALDSPIYTKGTSSGYGYCYDFTTTSFKVIQGSSSQGSWFAIGRWK